MKERKERKVYYLSVRTIEGTSLINLNQDLSKPEKEVLAKAFRIERVRKALYECPTCSSLVCDEHEPECLFCSQKRLYG